MKLRLTVLLLAAASACSRSDDGTNPPGNSDVTDAALSALVRSSTNWTYYKNRPDTLLRSVQSGHAEARLRTRFNARAATMLDAGGKVRAGAVFPDSSLIVKELMVGTALIRYAVMFKRSGSATAGDNGWHWAYYAPDGSTQISVTARGSGCQACHGVGIDRVRMNDSHP